MPGRVQESLYNRIAVKELHPTFGAEISGIDFSQPIDDETFHEVLEAISNDQAHVAFSARFGGLDVSNAYTKDHANSRLSYDELFDVNNLIDDGSLLDLNSTCAHFKKGNGLFHVDSSFNPRRAGFNLLRAVELPPPELGGETEFADSRPAFEGLPSLLKEQLLEKDYVVAHSLWQSRKLASPKFFNHTDPNDFPMTRHRLAQLHELSGRVNLYGGAHAHHIEGLDPGEWHALLDKLYAHATQPKYTIKVPWRNQGDVVLWDNTSVMHRAAGGAFEGRFRRDMCRATIHDGSSTAWGLNPVESKVRLGLP